ncbi:hypothetical protein PybrP1_007968, partial [[Pythium] brassicae (nom. inval.)]
QHWVTFSPAGGYSIVLFVVAQIMRSRSSRRSSRYISSASLVASTTTCIDVFAATPSFFSVVHAQHYFYRLEDLGGSDVSGYDDDDSDGDDDDYRGATSQASPLPPTPPLARRWRLFSAAWDGQRQLFGKDSSYGSFELELAVPGRVFVHVLSEDPDYNAERKAMRSGGEILAGKVVAMATNSELLDAVQVEETATGWLVAARGQPETQSPSDLVVYVYTSTDYGNYLGSVVARGAGDVVLTKKAVPRSAFRFAISADGGGRVFLRSSLPATFTSMALNATGSSSVYMHWSASVSISQRVAMTVDGVGAIAMKAPRFTAGPVATSAAGGGNICLSSFHWTAAATDVFVARNGSTRIVSDHATSSTLALTISESGTIDTGALSSTHTSVDIQGGGRDAVVVVGASVNFEYSAPSGAHVRYRGRGPRVVSAVAPGSPPLEKTQAHALKCGVVAMPDELAGGSAGVEIDRSHGMRIRYPGGEVVVPVDKDDSDDGDDGVTSPGTIATPPPEKQKLASALYFQLAFAFVAFLWLLHQILRCCDRRSRRRSYAAISGSEREDPPVLI